MTHELAAWLGAQIDADEKREARVYLRRYDVDGYRCLTCGQPSRRARHSGRTTDVEFDCGHFITSEEYRDRYLVSKPPDARAMAEIAFKRALLQDHTPTSERPGWCPVCAWATNDPARPYDLAIAPCRVLLGLATVYADRSGYQEAWKP